jgi:hypothetical protein
MISVLGNLKSESTDGAEERRWRKYMDTSFIIGSLQTGVRTRNGMREQGAPRKASRIVFDLRLSAKSVDGVPLFDWQCSNRMLRFISK